MLLEGLFLLRLTAHEAVLLEQLTGNAPADRHAGSRDALGNLAWPQIRPAYAALGIARCVFGNRRQKGLLQSGPVLDQPSATAPFFRIRPLTGSAGSSKSANP